MVGAFWIAVPLWTASSTHKTKTTTTKKKKEKKIIDEAPNTEFLLHAIFIITSTIYSFFDFSIYSSHRYKLNCETFEAAFRFRRGWFSRRCCESHLCETPLRYRWLQFFLCEWDQQPNNDLRRISDLPVNLPSAIVLIEHQCSRSIWKVICENCSICKKHWKKRYKKNNCYIETKKRESFVQIKVFEFTKMGLRIDWIIFACSALIWIRNGGEWH